jgi:hypothetical protein
LSSLVVIIRFFRIECSMLSEVRIGEKDITVKATTRCGAGLSDVNQKARPPSEGSQSLEGKLPFPEVMTMKEDC